MGSELMEHTHGSYALPRYDGAGSKVVRVVAAYR
jgi:hypothetical protein